MAFHHTCSKDFASNRNINNHFEEASPHPAKLDFGEPTASGNLSPFGAVSRQADGGAGARQRASRNLCCRVKMEQEPREPVVTASNATHYNRGFPSVLMLRRDKPPWRAVTRSLRSGFGLFFRLAGVPRLCRSTTCLTDDARFTGLKSGGHSPAGSMLHIPVFLNL